MSKQQHSPWINALRPWTLKGAVIPVLLGGIFAWADGFHQPLMFVLALLGGSLLQIGSNLINTYGDYKTGVDDDESAMMSPELVSGALKPKQIYWAGILCFLITACFGIIMIMTTGWGILVFGLLGILLAYSYTAGVSYKYLGLGQLMVFIAMGILMPMGTYNVMSGTIRWDIILISLPNAFLITAVLGGNELRDWYYDIAAGIRTFSGRIGYRNSELLYRAQHIAAYVSTILLVICGLYPLPALITLLSIPELLKLLRNCTNAVNGDKQSNINLVLYSFKLHWHFGLLLVIGCGLGFYFNI